MNGVQNSEIRPYQGGLKDLPEQGILDICSFLETFQKLLSILATLEKFLITFGTEEFYCFRFETAFFQPHFAHFIQVHKRDHIGHLTTEYLGYFFPATRACWHLFHLLFWYYPSLDL